jgi:hypothetical protein
LEKTTSLAGGARHRSTNADRNALAAMCWLYVVGVPAEMAASAFSSIEERTQSESSIFHQAAGACGSSQRISATFL